MPRARVSSLFVSAISVICLLAVLLIAFTWAGPGLDTLAFSNPAPVLYDQELVVDVYHRVSPAVVEIEVDRQGRSGYELVSSGTGFLVDGQGYIATNNHVVQGADRVRVTLKDDTNLTARVVGWNPANDLALLKVPESKVAGIEPVELGDSDSVVPGQMVIVIGSPFALKDSVTVGVSSGVDRDLRSELNRRIPGMIQTDALVGPGNSGSPLLDREGRVVGVTTALELMPVEANSRSIGFAVPVNTLKDLLPRLKRGGLVRPPWLGTHSRDLEPLLVERLDLPTEEGVYVTAVTPGSPVERAGLVPSGLDLEGRPGMGGDIIIAVDGAAVTEGADLTSLINRYEPGDVITLTVLRCEAPLDLSVTLGRWPDQ